MTEFNTQPDPTQPGRCPSIDPYDTLQCGRSIHEDEFCQFGGIAWKKGTPKYISAEVKLAEAELELDKLRRWKNEAVVELMKWDEVWVALDKPGKLGGSKADACFAEIQKVNAALARMETEVK